MLTFLFELCVCVQCGRQRCEVLMTINGVLWRVTGPWQDLCGSCYHVLVSHELKNIVFNDSVLRLKQPLLTGTLSHFNVCVGFKADFNIFQHLKGHYVDNNNEIFIWIICPVCSQCLLRDSKVRVHLKRCDKTTSGSWPRLSTWGRRAWWRAHSDSTTSPNWWTPCMR